MIGIAIANSLGLNFLRGIFGPYKSRVEADGGITEAGQCVDAGATPLLQSASLLLIPSGYKSGKAYAEIPTNGNGDLTWSRASTGTRTNASGIIEEVAWNLLTYTEEFDNAAWTKSGSSISANATTSPNGTTTADKLIETATSSTHWAFQSTTTTSTSLTVSCYMKKGERNFGFIRTRTTTNDFFAWFNLNTGTLGTVNSGITASIQSVGDGWYRCIVVNPNPTTSANPTVIGLSNADNVSTYTGDGTSGIYIWGAQLVVGTDAKTYLPVGSTRNNYPRLSYMYGSCPALLAEPQRTNSIRNSTMVGAVAGTPGTIPTNWQFFTNANLTRTIVGTGTENGLTYLDIRYSGTATFTGTGEFFYCEPQNQIAAAINQNWTNSIYIKLISGTMPTTTIAVRENNSSGVYTDATNINISVTSTLQRFNLTRTLTGATTAFVSSGVVFNTVSGTSYDFTFRIAQPQLELGAYATTPIFTTGSASATRVADSFSRNNIYTNGLISASGGTWFVELRNNIAYTRDVASNSLFIADNSASSNNAIVIRTGSGRLAINKQVAGSLILLYITTTDTSKIAVKWNGTSCDVFVNGTKQVSASSFTTTIMEFFGGNGNDVPKFIQQMALFPTPLSDAQCTQLTTL